MLSIPEYRAAAAGFAKRAWWVNPLAFLNLLVCLGPIAYLLSERDALVAWARTHLHPEFPTSALPLLLGWAVCCLVEAVLFNRLVRWRLARLARRDSRLVCPHCRWCPGQGGAWCEAVATRRCPGCGREFLADVAQPAPAAPPVVRAELGESVRVRSRVRRRTLRWRWGIFLVALGVVAGFALRADSGRASDPLAVGGIMTALVACAIASAWLDAPRRKPDRVGIACPRCGGRWAPEWALKYGGCGFCGQPLVADPEPAGVAVGSPVG